MSTMHITCDPKFPPTRAHTGDAGLDLMITQSVTINPHETKIVGTGVAVALPPNTAGFVTVRSSTGLKDLGLANDIGVIDSGYRGEIKLLLQNRGRVSQYLPAGTRVAQLIVLPIDIPGIKVVENLDTTARGEGGFGSTGQ